MRIPLLFTLSLATFLSVSAPAQVSAQSPAQTPSQTPAPQGKAPQGQPAQGAPAGKKAIEDIVMPTLWVGDDAPAFSVAKWVHGTGVEKLERGKCYLVVVVGPSASDLDAVLAPLSELQKKHAGKLTVLATVSNTPREEGSGLKEAEAYAKAHGAEMGFAFGCEKDSSLAKGWVSASRQPFPPVGFLVDANGKLAFIGDVAELEPSLGAVLAGKQDLKAAAEKYRKEFTYLLRTRKYTMGFELSFDLENWERAIQNAEALIELNPVEFGEYAAGRFLATANGLGKLDEAYAYANSFLQGIGKDSVPGLMALAWTIVSPEHGFEPCDTELALKLASRAVTVTERKDAGSLDTLAVIHFMRDELEIALTVAKESAKLDPKYEQRVREFEKEIEARKAKK